MSPHPEYMWNLYLLPTKPGHYPMLYAKCNLSTMFLSWVFFNCFNCFHCFKNRWRGLFWLSLNLLSSWHIVMVIHCKDNGASLSTPLAGYIFCKAFASLPCFWSKPGSTACPILPVVQGCHVSSIWKKNKVNNAQLDNLM